MNRGYLFIAIATVMFGTFEVALKYIAGEVNSVQLTFTRFFIGFLFLAPLAWRTLKKRGLSVSGRDLGYFALLGLVGIALCMPIYQLSVNYTDSGVVAVLFSCNPVFVTFLAFLFLGEPVRGRHVAALVLEVAGTVAIINPFETRLNMVGVALTLAATILFAIYGVMGKKKVAQFGGPVVTCFGFLFGSIFGFEDVLPALWIRPIDHMTTLPFLGKLNTVFIVSVAFGMFLIIVAMILHIINAAKSKDIEAGWFEPNGVAGLVFYVAVVVTIILFMTGNPLPGGIVMAIMFGVPLIVMLFREPLTKTIQKRTDKMETGKAMFIVQGFFEMFETLLSYFSNTISFIRIGAFAVSHAAIMEVVLQLAGAESGNPNWIGVIFGNLFVCGFEGLIVGIQVLRLEYYEMFSRFYKGSGHAFDPYTKKNTKTSKK